MTSAFIEPTKCLIFAYLQDLHKSVSIKAIFFIWLFLTQGSPLPLLIYRENGREEGREEERERHQLGALCTFPNQG